MLKRKLGRPAQRTPRPLLVAMARTMLERRVKAWRAACIVADSPDGKNFANRRVMARDSVASRLCREFLPMAQNLLAEAGRLIESDRPSAKRRADLRNSGGVLALGGAFFQTPAFDEAWMSAHSRFGVSGLQNMTPIERLIEQEQREIQRQIEEIERRYRSTLFT